MRVRHQTTSGATLHGMPGLYHLTRLKADPECADLATAFQVAQDQLKTRLDQHEAARATAMTALAVRDTQNAALGRQVRAFCLAVLARVNNNRRAPLYQTYFPTGLRAVISAPIDIELTRVGSMLAKLNEETDPQLTTYLEPLQAAADSMRAERHPRCFRGALGRRCRGGGGGCLIGGIHSGRKGTAGPAEGDPQFFV